MTLEERKTEFCELAYSILGNESITDFLEYWTEHSINGKKMRYEKETVFNIKRRFATWKRNNEKWNKPINTKPSFQEQAIAKQESLDKLFKQIDNGIS